MINSKKYEALYQSEKKKIDKILSNSFMNREPKSIYSPSLYIVESSGKRIRPMLVLFSAKAVQKKKIDAYNAAAAVELLHNFTLVHDDIMDNADKRRNKLTLHKKYDLNTAILVGDSLLSIAYEFLLKDLNGNAKDVVSNFTKGLVEVCEGQSLDKEFESKKKVSIDEYLIMIQKKTAAMIEMSCSIGALIGNGTQTEINALSNFGKNIGIAFQIQDDFLDIAANEEKFGKKIGGDLIEGKKTFLFLKAFEKADKKMKKYFDSVIENKGIKQSEVEFYKNLYLELDVLNDAKNEIVNYTSKALNDLKKLKNKEDRELFFWLANQLINRSK